MTTEKIPALDAINQKNIEAMRKAQIEAMQAFNVQLQNQTAHLGVLERGLRLAQDMSKLAALDEEADKKLIEVNKYIVNGLHTLFVPPAITASKPETEQKKEAA